MRKIISVLILLLAVASLQAAKHLAREESGNVNQDFIQANALLNKGDYTGALEKLTCVLIKEPGNGVAREQVYQIAQLIGANAMVMSKIMPHPLTSDERADAIELAYKSLRKTSPLMVERRLQEAQIQEKRGYYLLASQIYLAVLQLQGLELEKKYSIEKRLRSASQKVNARIDVLAEDFRGIYREAFTLMNVGDWEGSVESWQKYIDKGAKDPEVQKLLQLPETRVVVREREKIDLALVALRDGDVPKSKALFEEALKINPNSTEAEKGLEEVSKRIEDAAKLELVAKLVADAETLLGRGKKYQALQLLSQALRENPSDQKVLAMIQQIMSTTENQKTVFVNRPVIQKVFVEKPSESLNQEKMQTVRDTARSETHYQKGLVYYSLRNYREAFNEWKVAVQYDPNSRKITQALQRVQSDLQFEKAK